MLSSERKVMSFYETMLIQLSIAMILHQNVRYRQDLERYRKVQCVIMTIAVTDVIDMISFYCWIVFLKTISQQVLQSYLLSGTTRHK